ncbi:ATP-binding protein [Deinococcus kurensis]|uniref:ATP-binding protein n=1 Tax=Deinococcus kurensis TaxID=2662757 RepID=UPI0012D2C51C|nr:ATP-binding protein [Deinococcus kurensis]
MTGPDLRDLHLANEDLKGRRAPKRPDTARPADSSLARALRALADRQGGPVPAPTERAPCPFSTKPCPEQDVDPADCAGWLYPQGGARRCPVFTQHLTDRTATRMTIGASYTGHTWTDMQTPGPDRATWLKLQAWADTFHDQRRVKHSLLLRGEYGTGKTQATQLLRQTLEAQGHRVTFTDPDTFANALSSKEVSRAQVIREVTQADLLIVDDWGSIDAEWIYTALSDVLTKRDHADLPTVITTNLTLDRLPHYMSGTAHSRFKANFSVYELTQARRPDAGKGQRDEGNAAMRARLQELLRDP